MISPRIDRNTKVILQGISGRAGRLHSRLMKEYGSNLVGGVSPSKDIKDINGIPLFPDCASAVKATGATVSVVLVGAYDLLDAMREAVAAGIKMIVTPTEGMPVHDALKAKRLTHMHCACRTELFRPDRRWLVCDAIRGESRAEFFVDGRGLTFRVVVACPSDP